MRSAVGIGVDLAQRVARRRVVDHLACRERRQPARRLGDARVQAATVLPDARKPRAHDDPGARWQAVELARRRNGPLAQEPLQQCHVLESSCGILRDARRDLAAALERAQLLLDLEREVEGEKEDLRAVDRAALVRREWRKVVAHGDDRHRLRHPMHRRDVGELRPGGELLQVADHRVELARQEAVGIGEREKQCLKVDALGRHLGLVVRDRVLVQAPLARERVDGVRVEPGLRRHRRIGEIAVDQHPRDALQATVEERDEEPIAREQEPSLGLVQEQVLVGHRELVRERQRGLRRLERFASQRMRGLRKLFLELRPKRAGRRPVSLGELEPLRVAQVHPVDRGQRVADDAGRLDGVASEILVEPGEDLGGTGFGRIRGPRVDRRQAESERHSWSISGWPRRL